MNNLTKFDYQKLSASFITPEIADKAQISRVESLDGAETVGQERNAAKEDFSGLIFPYHFPEQPDVRERRLRRDNPPMELKPDGEYKEIGKYLTPSGRSNMLYFPPNVRVEHLSDISLDVVITEGEKKVLALHRASWHDLSDAANAPRFLPIGLTGVWNFRGVIGKTNNSNGKRINVKGTISDFDLLNWEDRKVYILYDANAATNDSVANARRRLAGVLKGLKARVFYVDLPEIQGCNGIDDVLGKIERDENENRACRFLFKLIADSTTCAKSSSFDLRADGVYFIEKDKDNPGKEVAFRVCSPLLITAETQTERGERYGRLLEWRDSQNRAHRWAMPIEFVHSDSSELAKYLASNGLEITPSRKHREKLAFYIADSKPEKVIISTDKIGWNNECFILPGETVGDSENEIVYQTEYDGHHNFQTSGSLEDWQNNIAKYCSKNSRLLFAVSTAFAAPLLPIVQTQGGGFHFRGQTSTGKTTASLVGGSVWGGDAEHGFVQTWKATANGLEIVAAGHNHALLCLDEIGECDSRTVGEIAYMLANGRGKARMTKTLQAKHSLTWNLLFLSTGEQSLADKMMEAGGTVKGGQEVRFCDIEADTGVFGLFETLHDFPDGQGLSDHLRSASCRFYGSPIRAFLSELTKTDSQEVREKWQIFKTGFISEVLPSGKDASSEVLRVAARFALVAFGGEVATDKGVTLWTEGEALQAASAVFSQWLAGREGTGQTDAENAVRQVRAFLEEFGQSRFQNLKYPDEKILNRAGYFRRNEITNQTEYFILPEIFRRHICKGMDFRFVAKILAERGFLEMDRNSPSKIVYLSKELGSQRVYVVQDMLTEKENKTAANA